MENKVHKNIKEKIVNEQKESQNLNNKIKETHNLEMQDLLFFLSDKDSFKQKFLIPHYKMYNILLEINEKIKELRTKKLSEEELKENLSYFYKKKLELAESRLEIYFCNAIGGNPKALKALAKVAMPFGLTHTGILVDDLCIQWGRGILGKSLVNPSKSVLYNDFIFTIELENKEIWKLIKETYNNISDYITGKLVFENIGTLKAFNIADEQLENIASICVDYNKNKKYNLVFENCQKFVTRILDKLKLKVNKSGDVGKVYKSVENKCNIIDFIFKGRRFTTRRSLDEFILQIDFDKLPSDKRKLLFCFRNTFEYYLRNKPNEEKYKTSDLAI